MTSSSPTITVRDGTLTDGDFILGAFDSAITYLPTIGSADQWGSQLFSQRGDASMDPMTAVVKSSVVHTEHQARPGHEGDLYDLSRDDLVHARCLIADSTSSSPGENDTKKDTIPVATLCYQDFIPPHIISNNAEFKACADAINARPGGFIYVWALVSDFNVDAARRKGAGGALLSEVKRIAKERGIPWMYLDCWTGNERKLVQ